MHLSREPTFLFLLVAISSCYGHASAESSSHTFQEVMDVIQVKQQELSKHHFFKFLSDESIPASKRIQFVPYWTYFALAAADILDCWFRIPNPKSELERRINTFINEDNFHYNLFLHDIETVLGYTPSRFGSLGAILRHIWSDETKAIRMLIFAWASGGKKSDDPMVALASFEAVEAGLKDFCETVFAKLFYGKDGYPDLQYFGQAHVDLELNHTVTAWFQEDHQAKLPLEGFEITKETKRLALEVVEDMFYWFHKVYDSLHNLCLADENIFPEKYIVQGNPPMNAFPAEHPNRVLYTDLDTMLLKDEL